MTQKIVYVKFAFFSSVHCLSYIPLTRGVWWWNMFTKSEVLFKRGNGGGLRKNKTSHGSNQLVVYPFLPVNFKFLKGKEFSYL